MQRKGEPDSRRCEHRGHSQPRGRGAHGRELRNEGEHSEPAGKDQGAGEAQAGDALEQEPAAEREYGQDGGKGEPGNEQCAHGVTMRLRSTRRPPIVRRAGER